MYIATCTIDKLRVVYYVYVKYIHVGAGSEGLVDVLMAEDEELGDLVSPEGLYMHPQPDCTAQPSVSGARKAPSYSKSRSVSLQACRSLVAPTGVSQPGCLAALSTLSWPLEQSVHQFSEKFSHAMEEVKSRVTNLWARIDNVAQQTAVLGQRQEQMDSRAADLERQQSRLSDDLSSRMSDSERRQSQLSEDIQNLSSDFEQSTSDLEEVKRSAEQRAQELEQQAVDSEVRSQALQSEVKQLTEQMREVVSKWDDIQLQCKNAKNWEDSNEGTLTLLNRLDSMEKRMKRLESSIQHPKPKRSISN